MTDKNGVGVTVVGHDSEDRILVKGYEAAGSYVRNVVYIGASVTQQIVSSLSSTNVTTPGFSLMDTVGGYHVTTYK